MFDGLWLEWRHHIMAWATSFVTADFWVVETRDPNPNFKRKTNQSANFIPLWDYHQGIKWSDIVKVIHGMDLDSTQLQAATHTFQLVHHRNKNQHRHSKWWKWFCMLKRCVSKLIHEIQAGDDLRAQARVKKMNEVLLPRCYMSFAQLIADTQFSTLGLTLLAELAKIRRLMAPYTDRVDDEISPATKLVDSRYRFPLSLSEDIGKPVGRTASNNHASVREAVDVITPSERGRYAEKHLHERDGAALDATSPANGEIELPQPGSGAAIAGIKSVELNIDRLFLNSEPPKTGKDSTYTRGLLSGSDVPGTYPEKQATIADTNTEMLSDAPRHTVEIFGRKDRPDEQMRSQSWTRPVTAESQYTHSHYAVSIDTVVSIGKINRRDGVGAAKGEE
ncbi:hypothetical protein IMSHALPRED_004196 [Imshaugia aleurites]|uniref:RNase MRP protein 1 RNA binding domain-containing protein n=1 Tax=Imshaugia aleurites TaxID=172621 RepID=A0A8H3ELS1_9LECA|nr:hypothetical protein IMSHALPRED_004196 [Imshaugia aleurites]